MFVKRAVCWMGILLCLMLAGCMKSPGPFETPEDFQRAFAAPDRARVLPAEKVLTLQRAVEIALLNNPSNLAAAQAVTAARYGYYRALSAYAPEINAGYSMTDTLSRGWALKNPPEGVLKKNDHFVTSGTLHASLLLFDGFARELETIIAKQEYRKSMAAEKNVRRLLERAVSYAYYDMYLAGEEMTIYRADLDFQDLALRQEEERFRNGHVSKASVLNFRILAARAQSSISNARYRRQVAFHALTALMGCEDLPPPDVWELQKISSALFPEVQDDLFYLELAVRHRPDLEMEKRVLEIAFRQKQKAIADFLPQIRVFSEFALETYNAGYGGAKVSSAHSRQGIFNYGMEGSWNLFRGWDSVNNLRRLAVLEKIAMWGLNAKFLEIAAEVRDACANCRNARRQIDIFQSMAQWVREQRDLVFSEYRNGRETITRLNEAQSALIEAQSRLVISEVEFLKAIAQLAAAAGTEVSQLLDNRIPE